MAIERIKPGYYYLTKHDKIESIPTAIVGTGTKAENYFKRIGALGYWYVGDSMDYNRMLQGVSKLRARLHDDQRF